MKDMSTRGWDAIDNDIDAKVVFRGELVFLWDLNEEEYEEYSLSKSKKEEAQDEG